MCGQRTPIASFGKVQVGTGEVRAFGLCSRPDTQRTHNSSVVLPRDKSYFTMLRVELHHIGPSLTVCREPVSAKPPFQYSSKQLKI